MAGPTPIVVAMTEPTVTVVVHPRTKELKGLVRKFELNPYHKYVIDACDIP